MNRGDILVKLQSASAAETCALSITDAAIQNASDANALNAFDTQSVFKLISSASDLEHPFAERSDATQAHDMQATTKNKRKNFKPRSATAVDTDPTLTDHLLNLMMQNKMKQLQHELHQGHFKRWTDDGKTADDTDATADDNIPKSPPSSPLTNGHSTGTGKALLFPF